MHFSKRHFVCEKGVVFRILESEIIATEIDRYSFQCVKDKYYFIDCAQHLSKLESGLTCREWGTN